MTQNQEKTGMGWVGVKLHLRLKSFYTLQPILGVAEGRQPMMAAGGHHQQHVTPMQLNGAQGHFP